MGKDQKGFVIYGDVQAVVDELNDEQAGKLFRAMLAYFATGKAPKFDGILKYVWIPIKQQMDRDKEKYEAKCEKNREKILLRQRQRQARLQAEKLGITLEEAVYRQEQRRARRAAKKDPKEKQREYWRQRQKAHREKKAEPDGE